MHPLNVTTLVTGLLCLGLSGIWLAGRAGWVDHGSYLFPVLLIVVGVIGLLAFAARGVSGRRPAHESPDTDTATATDTDDQEVLR